MKPGEKITVEDAANEVYRRLAIKDGADQPADSEIPVVDRGRRQQAHARLAAAVKADKITLWFQPKTKSGGAGPPEQARLDDAREYFEGLGWLSLGPRSSDLARSLVNAKRKYFKLADFQSWLDEEFGDSKAPQKRSTDRESRKSSPQQERVRPVLNHLYPEGVPDSSLVSDTQLCKHVANYMDDAAKKDARLEGAPSRDTILRAAGRMSAHSARSASRICKMTPMD